MGFEAIISAEKLSSNISQPNWIVVDCRYSLENPGTGYLEYKQGHIPGARYADLEKDLSGMIIPGVTGRHPLPHQEVFAKKLGSWGIDSEDQVIAYDDQSGAYAARLWWMLRWMGHKSVAVLDGGWKNWISLDLPIEKEIPVWTEKPLYTRKYDDYLHATIEDVAAIQLRKKAYLIDAREYIRYLGLHEPIDPIAGHIPSAISRPYLDNLDSGGKFKSSQILQDEYKALLGNEPPEEVIVYCGSGVTAAHNILAMYIAGYKQVRLYSGSWSEWIIDNSRSIRTGPGD